MIDLDEIYGAGASFWRSFDQKAPHNLYTGTDRLDQAFAAPSDVPMAVSRPWLPVANRTGGISMTEPLVSFPGQIEDVRFVWDSVSQRTEPASAESTNATEAWES